MKFYLKKIKQPKLFELLKLNESTFESLDLNYKIKDDWINRGINIILKKTIPNPSRYFPNSLTKDNNLDNLSAFIIIMLITLSFYIYFQILRYYICSAYIFFL